MSEITGRRKAETLLFPVDKSRVLVLEPQPEESAGGILLSVLPGVLKQALGSLGLPDVGVETSARLFSLRPEDEAKFDALKRMYTADGQYFRGTLTDDDKKFAAQMAFREHPGSAASTSAPRPAVDPAMAAMAAQMVALQVQVEQIHELLKEVAVDVQKVKSFLEREQASEVAAAVFTIDQIHSAMSRSRRLSGTDWSRVAPLEQVVVARHIAIVEELRQLSEDFHFSGQVERDKGVPRKVDAQRTVQLVEMDTALRKTQGQWIELYAVSTEQEGMADAQSIEELRHRLYAIEDRGNQLVTGLLAAAQEEPRTRQRSIQQRLKLDGAVIGYFRDVRNIDAVDRVRKTVAAITAKAAVADLPVLEIDAVPQLATGR